MVIFRSTFIGMFLSSIILYSCGRSELSGIRPASELFQITYQSASSGAIVGTTNISLSPSMVGEGATFTISPPLPAGISLDSITGKITGVPTSTISSQNYTITATNYYGSIQNSITLSIATGKIVDTTSSGNDDDGGTDSTCFSTAAGGCSLQAAIQTCENGLAGNNVIILPSGTYIVDSRQTINEDLTIQGAGIGATIIAPTAPLPGHGFISTAGTANLNVQDLSADAFGLADGAFIHMSGTSSVNVSNVHAYNNQGTDGGVFFIRDSAHLDVKNSIFSNNTSPTWGGVIQIQNTATASIGYSLFYDNVGDWGSVSHASGDSVLEFYNSTFYNNQSTQEGLFATPEGDYILKNITAVFNTNSTTGTAGIFLFDVGSKYTISNSIFAFNTNSLSDEKNCYIRIAGGTVTSLGNNIFSDDADNCNPELVGSDLTNTDPLLTSITPQDNGGPTNSFDLEALSPAKDGGDNTYCTSLDQRGTPRPINGTCDIGSLESY